MTGGWHEEALCAQVDPELFFPETSGSTLAPKRVCRACPVRAECLDWVMAQEAGIDRDHRFGVAGGLSPRERYRLARQRRRDTGARDQQQGEAA